MEEYYLPCRTTPSELPIFTGSLLKLQNAWRDCMIYRTNEVAKSVTKGATGKESEMAHPAAGARQGRPWDHESEDVQRSFKKGFQLL